MVRFIIKLLLLFALVFIVDRAVGALFAKVYTLGKVNYIAERCCDDLLVFGSSRAENHYNTRMIEDSLGISSYNCGLSGFGIVNAYGNLLMIQKRHQPQIILYDVTPKLDFSSIDNHRFLTFLKPKYDYEDIKEIILRVDPSEKWKMMSYMYRYNSNYVHKPNLHWDSIQDDITHLRGYKPLNKDFDELKTKTRIDKNDFKYDKIKLSLLENFIAAVDSSTTMIAIVSPTWGGLPKDEIAFAKYFFNKHHITFWDFSEAPKYFHENRYFYNPLHLNKIGSEEFTRDLIAKLYSYRHQPK